MSVSSQRLKKKRPRDNLVNELIYKLSFNKKIIIIT